MIQVLTHRGLDPSRPGYYIESTREAFADHIKRGYGLEFDVQFTHDGKITVFHDHNLQRLTHRLDARIIAEVDSSELMAMEFNGCHLVSLGNLIRMIVANENNHSINAIHVKSVWQKKDYLDEIIKELEHIELERFFIFDLTVESARYIKRRNARMHLAPSLCHPYDIERYNTTVGGTLLTIEEVIENRDLYDWVWLDEWDRTGPQNTIKELCNEATFFQLRANDFNIALVSPELHRSSPGLLGRESHQDAQNEKKLFNRINEIITLAPDVICTDFPDRVRLLLQQG